MPVVTKTVSWWSIQ